MQDDDLEAEGPQPMSISDVSEQSPQPTLESETKILTPASAKSKSKLAVSRVQRPAGSASITGSIRSLEKARVSHACEPCRRRKTKCSGEIPICKHCEIHKITCYYADGKRDRAKKQINDMLIKIEDYEQLLRQVISQVDVGTQISINALLAKSPGDATDSSGSQSVKKRRKGPTSELDEDQPGENFVTARVGSAGSMDRVDEDFNQNEASRAVGFIGKLSDVAWMQRLEYQLNHGSSTSGSKSARKPSMFSTALRSSASAREIEREDNDVGTKADRKAADAAYFLDDMQLDAVDNVEEFGLPPKNVADALLNVYLTTVHPSFPFILKSVFVNQYTLYYQTFDSRFSHSWLAILNLIFAISALYSHLTKAEWRGDERDHLVYIARARRLGLDDMMLLTAQPSFEYVQILSLMTFYLTASSQINRAWIFAGYATRVAQAMGMHLQNMSKDLSDVQKEVNSRLWWAIYSLEKLLCIMTGRPSVINDQDVSVLLPLIAEEEDLRSDGRILGAANRPQNIRAKSSQSSGQDDRSRESAHSGHRSSVPTSGTSSTSRSRISLSSSRSRSPSAFTYPFSHSPVKTASHSAYYLRKIHLAILTHSIIEELFTAKTVDKSWAHVQNIIQLIDSQLKQWRAHLPALFDFGKPQRDQTFYRQRLALGFHFYSAQMILYRPCLCRVDRHVPNQSTKSKEFNREGALICLRAARNTVSLIPNEPNPAGLYSVAPWWSILHHLMQAGTVLLLELAFRADHNSEEAPEILQDAKKVVRWLHSMSEDNFAARRACHQMVTFLKRCAHRINADASDIQDREPPQHQQQSNPAMQATLDEMINFDNTLSDPNEVFQQSQTMYPPSSLPKDSEMNVANQWSSYDDFDPFQQDIKKGQSHLRHDRGSGNPPGSIRNERQTQTSAMFPTSHEMDEMADVESRKDRTR